MTTILREFLLAFLVLGVATQNDTATNTDTPVGSIGVGTLIIIITIVFAIIWCLACRSSSRP